ncbi:hypothetical protein KIF24_31800 [Micromonospora sp. Llam7]|uniref:hypothetical protein n=1 Tax=Micromonospora tarapacensis TaxID=2835305 RepID=UPI001C83FC75|nr:hypothetical protein [Micromonospora tarapacensis]MBX7270157.1 hypothetical protein [Micromonospora tarapacensis]
MSRNRRRADPRRGNSPIKPSGGRSPTYGEVVPTKKVLSSSDLDDIRRSALSRS